MLLRFTHKENLASLCLKIFFLALFRRGWVSLCLRLCEFVREVSVSVGVSMCLCLLLCACLCVVWVSA